MKHVLIFSVLLAIGLVVFFGVRGGAHARSPVATAAVNARFFGSDMREEESAGKVPAYRKSTERTPTAAENLSAPASAAVESAKRCHQAAVNVHDWKAQLDACKIEADKGVEPSILCVSGGEQLRDKLRDAEKILTSCSQVPAEIRENFYRTTLEAAKAGDDSARLCYLNSDFDLHRRFSPSEADEYKAVAASYTQEGIERGDWRMVELLGESRRAFPRHYSVRSLLSNGEPFIVYKMNRLLRLGAEDSYADELDLVAGISRDELSQQEILDADTWAAETFSRYFSTSPKLIEPPTICETR
jgi:hypothetical protein